jgi:hypothetical protein
MDKQQLIRDLTERFEQKKEGFLSDVRNAVTRYISNQGADCLTLIERKRSGNKTWRLSAHPGYALRLIAFCRGAKYDGNPIDSGLTEPVIGVVTKQFELLYQSNDEEIARAIMHYILQDKVLSKGLVDTVVGSAAVGYAAGQIKEKAAALILDQLKDVMQTAGAKAVIATIGKTVAAVASKPIATKIAMLLMKFIAMHLKVVIAKVLATTAVKTLIAAAVKKFLIAAIIAALVKAVAAQFGISASAAFLWVLLPIIAGFILYEIVTFPDHLGEKVGDKVAEDLRGSYRRINDEVFEKVVSEVFDTGLDVMMSKLAETEEVQQGIKDLIGSLA